MPDRPLHRRIASHIRGQAVGYIAIFLALGGGYALAANTNTKTINGCVVKKTGELFVKSRCGRGQSKITWNQQGPQGIQGQTGAPGQAPPSAWATIGSNGNPAGSGVSSQLTSTGVFQVTFTPSACVGAFNAPVVTPFSGIAGTVPLAWIVGTSTANVFSVFTGTEPVGGGAFTPANLSFDVQDVCP